MTVASTAHASLVHRAVGLPLPDFTLAVNPGSSSVVWTRYSGPMNQCSNIGSLVSSKKPPSSARAAFK